MTISDLEYVRRELEQADEGMSYTLCVRGARAVRKILDLPGVASDGPTAKAVLDAIEELSAGLAEDYH